jgi:hypothetical protein
MAKEMNYEKEIERLLYKLPHRLQVTYALDCAESVFHLVEDKDKEVVRKALDTTALWLIDKASSDEVYAAHSAYSTASAADAAYYAVYAASNADAAYYAAYYAAVYAYYAACSASAATAASSRKGIKHYYEELLGMIKRLTELDKLIYDLNDKELL